MVRYVKAAPATISGGAAARAGGRRASVEPNSLPGRQPCGQGRPTRTAPRRNAAGAVKRNLNLVVRRRNRIVHRCDLDPTGTGTVLPASDADAVDAINTLEGAVTGIDAFV